MENLFSVPIGKPVQNTTILILDRHMNLCPPGVKGEICVTGLGVGKGYWKDDEKTAKVFVRNPFSNSSVNTEDHSVLYKTGDLGCYLQDGNVEYLGRLDEQVKIRGYRIELGEIEHMIMESGFVNASAVLATCDEKGNKRLIGYVVPGKGYHKQKALHYLRSNLPEYMTLQVLMELENS